MTPQITPITIIRDTVFEQYFYFPSDTTYGIGQDFTGYTFNSKVANKPGGTTLATFTVSNTAPPDQSNKLGWIKLSLDDATVVPTGYYRGTWSLLASPNGTNPVLIAGGPVDIISQGTTIP